MKKRILLWLCQYSYKIVSYIFNLYFLIVFILYFFDIKISNIVAYLFWLLLGIYLGYTMALKIIEYMRR
jgi:hypothetical protein